MNTLVKLLLLVFAIFQLILTVAAERAGNYPEAIYELLWLVILFYGMKQDYS